MTLQATAAKLAVVAQDTGGAEAVAPVARAAAKKGISVASFCSQQACAVFARERIPFEDVTGIDVSEFERRLSAYAPSALLTGTSFGLSSDKLAIRWAQSYSVPSCAVVDFWVNYVVRFSTPESSDYAYLPTKICVIDPFMRDEAVKAGIPGDRIVITGNPHLDVIIPLPEIEEGYFLFVDQPFSELYPSGKPPQGVSFFNEVVVFDDIVRALKEAGITDDVIIGLHPRTKNRDRFSTVQKSQARTTISDKSFDDLLPGARLVIGINSMALFKAALRGRRVVSYQPGLDPHSDPLPSNRMGLSTPVYAKESLKEAIGRVYAAHGKRSVDPRSVLVSDATMRVLDVLQRLIEA